MRCHNCGGNNSATQKYCGHCGGQLQSSDSVSGPVLAALGSSVPDDLAARIIQSRSAAIESELKQATILFADIGRSTAMIENVTPEEANERVFSILRAMVDSVHEQEGFVNRIIGDELMVLFGAPIALEDHALSACRAALKMQQAGAEAAPDEVNIHIGLDSGQVLVRSIHNDLSVDLDVVGATANIANRLQKMARPSNILLTENTYALAEGFLETNNIGPQDIDGISIPVTVHQLTGIVSANTRWDVRARRGLTELVGRDTEMESLRAALTAAESRHGQFVAVVGEPGIGKSRLVHEIVNSNACEEWEVLTSATAPHARYTAYFAIRRLLRRWFQIDPNDSQAVISKKIGDRINNNGSEGLLDQHALRSVMNLAVDDEGWKNLDPIQQRRNIKDAVISLVHARTQTNPIAVVVEDLHWLDTESQSILASLAEDVNERRLLVLVTYRPEYDDNWMSDTSAVRIRLDPLDSDESSLLLTSIMGPGVGLRPLRRELVQRSGGTPLFLEEMVRTLVESGALEGVRGAMHLTRSMKEINIPVTIQSGIAARIDLLPPIQKTLLQLASVIGKDVSTSILLDIAELEQGEFDDVLRELTDLNFLQSVSDPGVYEYTFNHELTREVTYEGILTRRRRQLHSQVVEAIESRYRTRLDEHIDRLAHHALHGGLWQKAADYHLQACNRAILTSANREALALLDSGDKALANLPPSNDREKAAIDIRLMANTALISLGELERMVHNLHEAEAFAIGVGDKRRLASVNTWISIAEWLRGNHELALKAGKDALATAEEIENPQLQFAAGVNIGMAFHGIGDYQKAIAYHEMLHGQLIGGLRYQRAGWAAYPVILINTFLASSFIEIGDYDKAWPYIEDACNFAEEVNHPYSQAMILDYRGYYFLSRGDVPQAIEEFEIALEICRDYEILNLYRSIAAKLGMAYTRSGRTDEAIALLEPAIDPADYLKGGTYVWHWLYLGLGEAQLNTGQIAEALRSVIRGVDLTRSSGERPHLAYATRLLGDVHAAQGGSHARLAFRDYKKALELAESCQMRPLIAHCHNSIGELYQRTDLADESETHLQLARKGFEELGLNQPTG